MKKKKKRAKAPTKIVRPPSFAAASKAETPAVRPVTPPPIGSTRSADRMQAGMLFAHDLEQRDVLWWHKFKFSHIPVSTFTSWSASDEWYRRREQFLKQVQTSVAKQIVSEITQSQVEEVKELIDARNVARSMVVGKDDKGNPVNLVQPKTWGEGVGAFVKLDERLDEKRAAVMGALPLALDAKAGSGDISAGIVTLPFDDNEIRAMAEAAVRARFNLPPPPPEEKK